MRSLRIFGLATLSAALAASNAHASSLDVCDSLGLSGLTISSDTNCLQITGNVQYEFDWGDSPSRGDDGDTGGLDVCDQLGLSGLTISSDDSCLTILNRSYFYDPRPALSFVPYFTTSTPTYYPFLATENPPGTIVNPALNVPVGSSGFGLTAGFGTGLGGWGRIDADLDYSTYSGSGQIDNVPLPNGFGVTTHGTNTGVFAGFDTLVRDATTNVRGTQIGANVLLGMPLTFAGDGITTALSGGIGPTISYDTQRQETTINTDTPLFGAGSASVITYDSDITTYAIGLDGQIEMSGFFPVGGAEQAFTGDSLDAFPAGGRQVRREDLMLPYYQISGGINPMILSSSVNDTVDAQGLGGALNYQSSNTFDAQNFFLGASLGAEVGVVKGNIRLSLSGAVNLVPQVVVDRVNSDAGGTPLLPVVRAVPAFRSDIGLNLRIGF